VREEGVGEGGEGAGGADGDGREEGEQGSPAGSGPCVGAAVGIEEPGGQRERRHQQQGIGEVDRLHEDAGVGGIVLDVVPEDEDSAERSFEDEEGEGPENGGAGGMAARGGAEDEGDEGQVEQGADARCRTVNELDQGGEAGVVGEEVAIAERPVCAAACA
jgi:hypothetical protein